MVKPHSESKDTHSLHLSYQPVVPFDIHTFSLQTDREISVYKLIEKLSGVPLKLRFTCVSDATKFMELTKMLTLHTCSSQIFQEC